MDLGIELQIGLLFIGQIVVPLALLIWLWRPSNDRLHWIIKLVGVSAFLIQIYFVQAWPWLFYHLRFILIGLLVITILKSAWQARTLRNWPDSTPKVWLEYGFLFLVPMVLALPGIFMAVDGRAYPVDAVELSFPLHDGVYYVSHGGSNVLINHHNPAKAQQYALDVLELDAFGRKSSGLYPSQLSAYEIFGAPLYSPCDGVVVSTENTAPDLDPPEADRNNLAGNHVMIDCQGVEILLAHMQQGSVLVNPGDSVKRDQQIGKVGNSGNTSEPHLHLHARKKGSGESLLDGTGVPMTFSGRYLVRNDLVESP